MMRIFQPKPPPVPTVEQHATEFAHIYTQAVYRGTGADAKVVLAQFKKYREAYIAAEPSAAPPAKARS